MNQPLAKQVVAEFIGTFALIFIGIGAIHHLSAVAGGLLGIALAHGLAIAVMVSATAAISGGHLNPAVSVGLLIGGRMDFTSTVAYVIAQCAGGTAAALAAGHLIATGDTKPAEIIIAGTPALGKGVSALAGVGIEAVLTFFLVFVVFGTAADGRAPKVGGLFIGLTVTLDILFGGPLTGGAMNVARWLGPALAANHFENTLVYIAGPLLGGAAAGGIYGHFLIKPNDPSRD